MSCSMSMYVAALVVVALLSLVVLLKGVTVGLGRCGDTIYVCVRCVHLTQEIARSQKCDPQIQRVTCTCTWYMVYMSCCTCYTMYNMYNSTFERCVHCSPLRGVCLRGAHGGARAAALSARLDETRKPRQQGTLQARLDVLMAAAAATRQTAYSSCVARCL